MADIKPTDWSEAGSATVGQVDGTGQGDSVPIDVTGNPSASMQSRPDGVREILQGFKDIFSPFSSNRTPQYAVITPPVGDPYQQNADALKSRRQAGSTPFQEIIINCRQFLNQISSLGAGSLIMSANATATATGVTLQVGTQTLTGDTTNGSSIIRNIATQGVQLSYTISGAGIPASTTVIQVGIANAPYAISNKMQMYLINFFGPNMNEILPGPNTLPSGGFPAWVTVQIPISGSFLKIDLLPGQSTYPYFTQSDPTNPNVIITDNTGILGNSAIPIQDYSQQSNRNIFVQFDSPEANILIAKPGRVFKTDGYDSIYLTFQSDNGRIRATAGFGQAEISDNDTSKLRNQNLHLWPGEEILNDPYLHPIPFSIDVGQLTHNATINTATTTTRALNMVQAAASVGSWRAFSIISNKRILNDVQTKGTINSGTHTVQNINAFSGMATGWITRISFSYDDFYTGAGYLQLMLCVGDPYSPDGLFSKRCLWQKNLSFLGTGNNSFVTEKNFDFTFPTPIRFTLLGGSSPNCQILTGLPSSWGDELYLAYVMSSNSGTMQGHFNIEGYMMGNLCQRFGLRLGSMVGDFTAGSNVITNINAQNPQAQWVTGNVQVTAYDSVLGQITFNNTITAGAPNSLTLTSNASFSKTQAPFSMIDISQSAFIPQTMNVHPFPLDRIGGFSTIPGNLNVP